MFDFVPCSEPIVDIDGFCQPDEKKKIMRDNCFLSAKAPVKKRPGFSMNYGGEYEGYLSTMSKLLFIINPIAGKGKNNIIPMADLNLSEFAKEYTFTEYPGHASVLARQAIGKGYAAIVSVGGDGTLNEVAKELVNTQENLAIIPLGSGNALARHLGIPIVPVKALRYLKNTKGLTADVGRINDTYFFTTCGFGFDAHIADVFSKNQRRGPLSYVRNIFQELFGYRSKEYRFQLDHAAKRRWAFILTLANTSQYGNRAIIAPDAGIDSGKLVCCLVSPLRWHHMPRFTWRLLHGKLNNDNNYDQTTCTHFRMTDYTGSCHIDGEPLQFKESAIDIEVIPAALRILVPN